MYHKYNDLVREGDYNRMASYSQNKQYDCYMVVTKDKSQALMTYVQVRGVPNSKSKKVKLMGLDPKASYMLEGTDAMYSGELLMKGGFLVKGMWGDAASRLYHFKKK